MARNYGKIETGFWQNAKVRSLSEDAQRLLIYVYSSPHSTSASAYVLPLAYACHDLNWKSERVEKAFQELSLKPFVSYDEATGVTYVPGWWGHNAPENPNVATYAAKLLLGLPDCPLKAVAIHNMLDVVKYNDAVGKILGEWSAQQSHQPFPSRLREQSFKSFVEPLPQRSPGRIRPSRTEPSQNPTETNPAEPDAPTRAKRRPMASNWNPDQRSYERGRELGLTNTEITEEGREFVEYWLSDEPKDPLKRDWQRAFRSRLREVANRIIQRRGRDRADSRTSTAETAFDEDSRRQQQSMWRRRFEGLAHLGVWVASYGQKPDLTEPWQLGMPEIWRELLPFTATEGNGLGKMHSHEAEVRDEAATTQQIEPVRPNGFTSNDRMSDEL